MSPQQLNKSKTKPNIEKACNVQNNITTEQDKGAAAKTEDVENDTKTAKKNN